jgi:hypothetical protein
MVQGSICEADSSSVGKNFYVYYVNQGFIIVFTKKETDP